MPKPDNAPTLNGVRPDTPNIVPNEPALFSQLSRIFEGAAEVRAEWSLRVNEHGLVERDRVTFWTRPGAAPDQSIRFTAIAGVLRAFDAPCEVIDVQRDAEPKSVWQGVGVPTNGSSAWCLYLHTVTSEGLARYVAHKWRRGEPMVDTQAYEFHYLPATPDEVRPESLVHPQLVGTFGQLLANERLQRLSGFWLCRRNDRIEQVDLAFSWHPPLSELLQAFETGEAFSNRTREALAAYGDQPLRHIAFDAVHAKQPGITLYFSAPLSGAWPDCFASLKRKVQEAGAALNASLERRIFSKLPPMAPRADDYVGRFYDSRLLNYWQQVLGPEMHYHFGIFRPEEKLPAGDALSSAPFERAVDELRRFIPLGASVYDVGCGWGGPARFLSRTHGFRVLGITLSKTQYRYCASTGMQVRFGDAETTLPPGRFDCLLLMESLEHIRDKARLLGTLRLFGKRLVMRVNCQDAAPESVNFANTMHMVSSTALRALIEEAGWRIVHWRDRRPEAMPSFSYWEARFAAIPVTTEVHLEAFRAFCLRVRQSEAEWERNNPLIEVIAE